jgi:hypothetical protein
MTTEEIAAYREEVVARLAKPEADGVAGPIPIFAFSESAKEAAGELAVLARPVALSTYGHFPILFPD